MYWTFSPLMKMPSAIFDNPEKMQSLAPCPVVGKFSSQTRIIKTPYDLKIKPNWFYNQVTEEYVFEGFDSSSKDVVDDFLWSNDTLINTAQELWYKDKFAQFQIVSPYVFVSEKDIDMYTLGLQNTESQNQTSMLRYIEAVIPIGKMARPLSTAWAFTNSSEAHFIKGQPLYKLLFSEPVELLYFSAGDKFKDYCAINNGFVNYQKRGTVKKFKNIFSRQPNKLFKEIKNNVVYTEA